MNETFTNIAGDDALIDAIVRCWQSVWGARVVSYRNSQGLDAEPAIAVVVQRMVDAERSGVMFTADPSTQDTARIVVEGAFGLGEVVVGGQVEPDTYVLSDRPAAARSPHRGEDPQAGARPRGHHTSASSSTPTPARRVLSDAEVTEVAAMGLRIERHYGSPQDIEWAFQDGTLYCLQARPITTLSAPSPAVGTVLVTGLGASTGRASGRVRVLASPAEGEALQAGEILVAPMTTPDWVPVLRRAAGLITDGGGMTCHAAIVSRELRIPCVVGTRTRRSVLRDGERVTLDGRRARCGRRLDLAQAARRPPRPRSARGAVGRAARALGDEALRQPRASQSTPSARPRRPSTASGCCAPSS
jgi:pyruvate,water dikinase